MRRAIRNALSCAILLCASSAFAAPGDTLFFDDFERNNLGSRWQRSNGGSAGLGNQTSNSGNRSMYIGERPNTITSQPLNFSAINGFDIEVWIRRGSDAFSEDPDGGENLVVEYLASDNNYYTVQTYTGSGPPGQIFSLTYSLPSDALHNGFRLRFRQIAGSGNNHDYYHIDDVRLTETNNSPNVNSPPLALGICDDFETRSLNNWTETGPGNYQVNSMTASSPTRSMAIWGGRSTVTSVPFDTSSGISTFSVWIRRGADFFSENPDGNENLEVAYLNDAGSWITLETFIGGGFAGQIHPRTYNLPPDASHAAFQVRFRLLRASSGNYDYWHIDDTCFIGVPQVPELSIRSDVAPPTATTGDLVTYALTVENVSGLDGANVVVTEDLSPYAAFSLDAFGPGVSFTMTEGPTPSGLTMGAASYSNDDAGSFTHPPTSGGNGAPPGFDGLMTNWRLPFTGTMPAGSSFTLQYRVRVE